MSRGKREFHHKKQHGGGRRQREQGIQASSAYVYGRQPVRELLLAGRRRVHTVWVRSGVRVAGGLENILELAFAAGVNVVEAEPAELDRMTHDGNHQGVTAHADPYQYAELDDVIDAVRVAGDDALLLCLDHLEDPQNVGAILRSAEAAGVTAVLIPKDRAAHVTAAALRASAGAGEHVMVALVVNLVQAMRQLKDEGMWFAGLEAVPEAVPAAESDLAGPWGIVVGAEDRGLGRLVRENCDRLIRLPLYGQVTSLNAGVAAALALYEIRRQREAG